MQYIAYIKKVTYICFSKGNEAGSDKTKSHDITTETPVRER